MEGEGDELCLAAVALLESEGPGSGGLGWVGGVRGRGLTMMSRDTFRTSQYCSNIVELEGVQMCRRGQSERRAGVEHSREGIKLQFFFNLVCFRF